jgi:hypothetical protein
LPAGAPSTGARKANAQIATCGDSPCTHQNIGKQADFKGATSQRCRDWAHRANRGRELGSAARELCQNPPGAVPPSTPPCRRSHLGKHWNVLRACSQFIWGRADVFSGWAARRSAPPIARLLASSATPQTARKGTCPSGWGATNAVAFVPPLGQLHDAQPTGCAVGRFGNQTPCMGICPCGAVLAANSSRLRPNATPNKL